MYCSSRRSKRPLLVDSGYTDARRRQTLALVRTRSASAALRPAGRTPTCIRTTAAAMRRCRTVVPVPHRSIPVHRSRHRSRVGRGRAQLQGHGPAVRTLRFRRHAGAGDTIVLGRPALAGAWPRRATIRTRCCCLRGQGHPHLRRRRCGKRLRRDLPELAANPASRAARHARADRRPRCAHRRSGPWPPSSATAAALARARSAARLPGRRARRRNAESAVKVMLRFLLLGARTARAGAGCPTLLASIPLVEHARARRCSAMAPSELAGSAVQALVRAGAARVDGALLRKRFRRRSLAPVVALSFYNRPTDLRRPTMTLPAVLQEPDPSRHRVADVHRQRSGAGGGAVQGRHRRLLPGAERAPGRAARHLADATCRRELADLPRSQSRRRVGPIAVEPDRAPVERPARARRRGLREAPGPDHHLVAARAAARDARCGACLWRHRAARRDLDPPCREGAGSGRRRADPGRGRRRRPCGRAVAVRAGGRGARVLRRADRAVRRRSRPAMRSSRRRRWAPTSPTSARAGWPRASRTSARRTAMRSSIGRPISSTPICSPGCTATTCKQVDRRRPELDPDNLPESDKSKMNFGAGQRQGLARHLGRRAGRGR